MGDNIYQKQGEKKIKWFVLLIEKLVSLNEKSHEQWGGIFIIKFIK